MRLCPGSNIPGFARSASSPWMHRTLIYVSLGRQRFSTWHSHPLPPSGFLSGNHLLSHQLCFLKHTCKSWRLSCWDHAPTQLVSLDRARALCDHLKHLQSFYFVFFTLFELGIKAGSLFLKSPFPPQHVYPDLKTWFFFSFFDIVSRDLLVRFYFLFLP